MIGLDFMQVASVIGCLGLVRLDGMGWGGVGCGVGVGRGCTSGRGYKAEVQPGTEVRVEVALKSGRRC